MTPQNYGRISWSDHCLPIASFNFLDENDVKKCFNWVNSRPMYVKDNIIEGDKVDERLYLLQEISAYQFIKLNEKRPDEDVHE